MKEETNNIENTEKKKSKKKIIIPILLIVIILIMGVCILNKDKIIQTFSSTGLTKEEREEYSLYATALKKYDAGIIEGHDGKEYESNYIALKMLKVNDVSEPVAVVSSLIDGGPGNSVVNILYYIKDGKVVENKFNEITTISAFYDTTNNSSDFYLVKYENGKYNHIINLSDYINQRENKREYDTEYGDDKYLMFNPGDEVAYFSDGYYKALSHAFNSRFTADELFKKNEKEIMEEYSEILSNKDDSSVVVDNNTENNTSNENNNASTNNDNSNNNPQPVSKCNGGFVYVPDDNRCYSPTDVQSQINRCSPGEVEIIGDCGTKVDDSLCTTDPDNYAMMEGMCIEKSTYHVKSIECPSGYDILFGEYSGAEFNGACYRYMEPNF